MANPRLLDQSTFERLRDRLLEVEVAFTEHCDACECDDSFGRRPAEMDAMAIAIRHFLCGELRRYLSDCPVDDLLSDLADYRHMQRKVAHGCWDATCPLCDPPTPAQQAFLDKMRQSNAPLYIHKRPKE